MTRRRSQRTRRRRSPYNIQPRTTRRRADRASFDPSEVFHYRGKGSVPKNVRRVEVDRSVTFIPRRLFDGCDRLESVLLHDGLLGIGNDAFRGCRSLRVFRCPSTVNKIGEGAFAWCSNLAAVEFPPGLESIEEWTFAGTSLEEARIPASVARIGTGAFDGCTNLASLQLREGLRMIGDWAFNNCRSLGSLRVPSSVDEIGEEAFDNCSSLSLVQLNEDLPKIEEGVFGGCPLESFQFAGLSERMKSIRMDDATKSMFESRLREITRALTSVEEDEDDFDDEGGAEVIRKKCKESLGRAHEVLTYWELNGSMPVLDLALWNAKIEDERKGRPRGGLADNEDGGQDARDAGRARQHGPQLSRKDCRVKSGASIVSAEVRKYFAYKTSWPRLDDLE